MKEVVPPGERDSRVAAPATGYPTHDGSRGGWYAAALKGAPHKRSIKRAVERRYPFLRFEWRSAGEHIDGVFERAALSSLLTGGV